MQSRRCRTLLFAAIAVAITPWATSCTEDARPTILGGTLGAARVAGSVFTAVAGDAFTEELIQERTFVQGQVVDTATYNVLDMARTPLQIDFNNDQRIDPVVGYQQDGRGVVQILLSYGDPGTVQFASLTLDGGEAKWPDLRDVAVGDIDGDGSLDIVVATGTGVYYLRHPSNAARTQVLSEWGQESAELELIAGTGDTISQSELDSLITEALGSTMVDRSNYVAVVKQSYVKVEIADFNNDGSNDIVASRQQEITLEPKTDVPLDPISIVAGSIQLLVNPGHAPTGELWTGIAIGEHERHKVLDREGASDLRAVDLDGDGDLDLISAASADNNVQIVWFENPGGAAAVDPATPWVQHRIGSLRGAAAIDVADLTGDGRVDVVGISPTQMQMVLFVQPEEGAARGYDWYSAAIVTFDSYEPRTVKALDVDNDGTLELVVGGTTGAVRYFEPPALPTDTWVGHIILTYNPPGDVGQLGYGDLDGDGDMDLVVVIGTTDEGGGNRVTWIRNELVP